ncbi:hypothetical protein [Comamonas antarctica]|uniref:hypothetical protein n=1 Tax=Comamonas antarctica TaxID=2743470 RepID=UPI0028EF2CFE|nr:hypothetical protein [Comamonas antarctica]
MDLISACRNISHLKISRFQLHILLGILSMGFKCGLHAQPLPEVTVAGSFGGFSSFSSGTGLDFSSSAQPFSGYAKMMGLLRSIELAEDVRCVGKSFENTTSHTEVAERWMAAEAVYRRVTSGRNLFEKIFGSSPIDPKAAKFVNVTYADGGTETWWVENPTFSTALSPLPVANSLKKGNGIPQPHPVCRNS